MRPDTKLEQIKGVGKVTAEKLAAIGLVTAEDLIYYFPRKYDDYSQVTPLRDVAPGKVTVKAAVQSVTGRYVRRGLHITEAIVADDTGKLRIVWFNQPYRAKQFATNQEYYFSGEYNMQRNRFVLQNPAAELAKNFTLNSARIVPIYRETKDVKSQTLRKLLHELLPLINMLPESLPESVVKSQKLMGLSEALQNLHFPGSAQKLQAAQDRIAFEEMLYLMLASQISKIQASAKQSYAIPFNQDLAKEFTTKLPYQMTDAQKLAAWEILQDLQNETPMNRLLQGDVGSGKTVVGAMAALYVVRGGHQAAFLAPTEVLAIQHHQNIGKLLAPFGVRTSLLLGSTKKVEKDQVKELVKQGEVDLVIGTHAIIQKDMDFKSLALVVVDEQHRFGVNQRTALLELGQKMPHLLSMTATPIPRSLQLTVYGELDVSILNQMPPGRTPIITQIVSPHSRPALYKKIDEQIAAGRQVYVVCPVIEEGENSELKSVQTEHQVLDKTIFKHRRVGLLHGQLKPAEKDAVMTEFAAGKIDILISTTVIEVGVDVPNATIMLIEGAERFGLAQLHQLRGRVGRGDKQSYCYLIPSTPANVSQRLKELESSTDGFYLAEVDLKLRGPGAVYGKQQHGKLDIDFVNLANLTLVKRVGEVAERLAKSNIDLLQYPQLNKQVNRYMRLTSLN